MDDTAFEKSMLRDMRNIIKTGNLEALKLYFFHSDKTNNPIYSDIEHNINQALLSSCYYGKLDIIEYVLHSPEIEVHANLHYKDDSAIFCAVEGMKGDVIDYLTSSPKLKSHIRLEDHIDEIFDQLISDLYIIDENMIPGDANAISVNEDVMATIHYLIYERCISPTEHILELLYEHMKTREYEAITKQFNSNRVYNNLCENLIAKDIKQHKLKL